MGKDKNELSDYEQLKAKYEMLNDRLDDIDSSVSAIVGRTYNQAAYITTTCPHCGKEFEISIIGLRKPKV